MRKRQRQLLRTLHGRLNVLENRSPSKLETTKQEKKRVKEDNKLNHKFISPRQTRSNGVIDPLNITKGKPLPIPVVEYPECPTHSTIILPSQLK